jgi:hypothetical protein
MFMWAICKAGKINEPFLTVFKPIYTIFKQSCLPKSSSTKPFVKARILVYKFQHLNQVIFGEIRRECKARDRTCYPVTSLHECKARKTIFYESGL